jgi:hypothetical protein
MAGDFNIRRSFAGVLAALPPSGRVISSSPPARCSGGRTSEGRAEPACRQQAFSVKPSPQTVAFFFTLRNRLAMSGRLLGTSRRLTLDDCPVLLTLPDIPELQIPCLVPPGCARQRKVEQSAIAFAVNTRHRVQYHSMDSSMAWRYPH